MTNDQDVVRIKRALISSYRKEPAVVLARELAERGVTIIASGGTADAIAQAGIEVARLADHTGFDNLLGGRIKTLHPAVYAGILARSENESDLSDLKHLNVELIDLVAVDLYPFPDTPVNDATSVELIDVGGVSMLRAAAKNFQRVAVLCHAEQFMDFVRNHCEDNCSINLEHRRELAALCFNWTSAYDARIAAWAGRIHAGGRLPDALSLSLVTKSKLRYGENPHQAAAFQIRSGGELYGIAAMEQLGGKQLSFNNLLDLDTAIRLPLEYDQPAAAILKHTTPCGVGVGVSILEAFQNAHSTDSQSAFGGIVGFNRTVDLETAMALRGGFVEVVCAPDFEAEALKQLQKSKNLRIIKFSSKFIDNELDIRTVYGGFLVQQHDRGFPELDEISEVTRLKPTDEQLAALKFAWKAIRYMKSNAILIADRKRTVGIGAGQMSRVDAAHLAVWKAGQSGLETKGCIAASDAFFPFRDGLDVLVDAGITAVIQPGGSIRDQEVIEAANERGISMVFTGRRHFRH